MRPEGYPSRGRKTASRLVDGEAVLVVPGERRAHVLNETGSAAWTMMDGSRTLGEIASRLADRYGADEASLGRDLERFAEELRAAGALDVRTSARRREDSEAARQEPPPPAAYAAPEVAETHPMEVVAGLCSSAREGMGGGGKPKPPAPAGPCTSAGSRSSRQGKSRLSRERRRS